MKINLLKLATLVFCLMLLASAGSAAKGKKAPSPMNSATEEETKEPAKKIRPTSEAPAATPSTALEKKTQPTSGIKPVEPTPAQTQPAPEIKPVDLQQPQNQPAPEIKPADRQPTQLEPAPVVGYKGRMIKWQALTGCGGFASASKGHQMSHTVGQGAVGYVSSGSHQAIQGFHLGAGGGGGPEERGDVNGDGIVNVGDIVFLVSYLYKGGPAPDPVIIGDCNCDEIVNVGDIVFLVSYLYKGGPEPVC